MTTPSPATPRREFLGQIATLGVALAGTACAGGAHASTAPAPVAAAPRPKPVFTDSWTSRITGAHKAVFDSPAIEEGTAIGNAFVFMNGYKNVYNVDDSAVTAVVVIRHAAIPIAMDDEFWAKYDLGKQFKIRDENGKKWAMRNPFFKPDPKAKDDDYTLQGLHRRGGVLIGCNLAANFLASRVATQTKQDRAVVFDELKAHLVPGLELAPSGIFAVTRAQEAGCSYVRST